MISYLPLRHCRAKLKILPNSNLSVRNFQYICGMDNCKWTLKILIPNIAMALIGVSFSLMCYGLLGWTLHWEPMYQPYKNMAGGLIGVLFCCIPWITNRQGRAELRKFITSKAFVRIVIVETLLWIFTLLERNEPHLMTYMYDTSFIEYAKRTLEPLCSLLFMLSCVAGIGVGAITFIIFMLQKVPKQLWDDKTPRKRN